jgi:hypothetical protein
LGIIIVARQILEETFTKNETPVSLNQNGALPHKDLDLAGERRDGRISKVLLGICGRKVRKAW